MKTSFCDTLTFFWIYRKVPRQVVAVEVLPKVLLMLRLQGLQMKLLPP
jgi:hypothetical protein